MAEAACLISILEFHVRIVGPRSVVTAIQLLFPDTSGCTVHPEVKPVITFTVERQTGTDAIYQIRRNGVPLPAAYRSPDLVPILQWLITSAAVAHLGHRYLLLHAGAVAWGDTGLVLPAKSGSGKTTLVAGLVAAGFAYLSDEVAVIEPSRARLLPFLRSMAVKAGARPVLVGAYPELGSRQASYQSRQEAVWLLPPPRTSVASAAAAIRYVVAPCYTPGAQTTLKPLARSQMLRELLEQSFSIRQAGSRGVEQAVAVLQQARCYQLKVGSLDEATEVLRRLVADG